MQIDAPTGQEPTEKSANFGNTHMYSKYATSRSATPNAGLQASNTNLFCLQKATVDPVLHQVAAPVALVRTCYYFCISF